MKRTVTIIILMVAAIVSMKAQTLEESVRYWDEGKLTWDDFEKRNFEGEGKCYLSPVFHTEYKTIKTGNLKYRKYITRTAFDKTNTWVRTEYISDRLLRYNQLILDIAEANRKDLDRDLNLNTNYSRSYIYEHYTNKGLNEVTKLAEESKGGDDITVIEKYEKEIASKLAAVEKDSIPDPELKNWGAGYQLGYSTGIFTGAGNELFKPHHNMTLGFLFSYKRSHMILDMEIGGGKTRQEMLMTGSANGVSKDVVWPAGESFGHTGIDLDYGYAVYDGAIVKVCPIVGVGVSIMSKEFKEGDETISTTMGGLQVLAGLNLNWKFSRSLTYNTYNENAIRTKLYAARTNLIKGMEPVWSVNLGLAFDFYGRAHKQNQ